MDRTEPSGGAWVRPPDCTRVHWLCDADSLAVLAVVPPGSFRIGDSATGHDPDTNDLMTWRCSAVAVDGVEWEPVAPWSTEISKKTIDAAQLVVVVIERDGEHGEKRVIWGRLHTPKDRQ